MHKIPSLMASILALAAVAPACAADASAAPALSAAGEGRRAFLQYNCYGCHGMYAGGGMGPSIVHAEKGDISEAVHQGESGGMPSFGRKLSSRDVSNLAAYLRSIGTPSEPKFMDWWVAVPPK